MFRTPETTALVGKLRERVQVLTMERDGLQAQLRDTKMDMRWVGGYHLFMELKM